jgi:methionyl-tRNA formyltransferase
MSERQRKPLKVLYMGTPDFSVPTLDYLFHTKLVNLCAVISMPDRPAGRGNQLKSPEVIEFARTHKIPFFQSENINMDPDLIKAIKNLKPDLIVVLAFAQFLNSEWLNIAPQGVFNIHTSLLPKYRGAAPIQAALLNGDSHTGVSIQKMVKKMDAGDVVLERVVSINPSENLATLSTRLKFEAALATHDFLVALTSNTLNRTPQDHSRASYAPSISKEQGYLRFASSSAEYLCRQILAFDPWPGTYCFINSKRTKILAATIVTTPTLAAGELKIVDSELFIGTTTHPLRIDKIQFEGKGVADARLYLQSLNHTPTFALTEHL